MQALQGAGATPRGLHPPDLLPIMRLMRWPPGRADPLLNRCWLLAQLCRASGATGRAPGSPRNPHPFAPPFPATMTATAVVLHSVTCRPRCVAVRGPAQRPHPPAAPRPAPAAARRRQQRGRQHLAAMVEAPTAASAATQAAPLPQLPPLDGEDKGWGVRCGQTGAQSGTRLGLRWGLGLFCPPSWPTDGPQLARAACRGL